MYLNVILKKYFLIKRRILWLNIRKKPISVVLGALILASGTAAISSTTVKAQSVQQIQDVKTITKTNRY